MGAAAKVRIDPSLCQGHGMCALACPDLFQLDGDTGHAFVTQEDVPPELVDHVDQAVRGCPEQAISLIS